MQNSLKDIQRAIRFYISCPGNLEINQRRLLMEEKRIMGICSQNVVIDCEEDDG